MTNLNQCNFIGNLTKDPEAKVFESGKSLVSFRIAVNGYKKEDVAFVSCKAWGKLGEVCAEYLKKGKKVFVSGRLELGNYEKDGVKVYTHDIVLNTMEMLSTKEESGQSTEYKQEDEQQPAPSSSQPTESNDHNDDIPF